jgi:hypothetical protein
VISLAHPTRFERVTLAFGGQRSTYAASIGMTRSINRKNRVLRAHATTDSCDIGAGDPEGSPFAFWGPFRRDRVLRLPATRLSRKRQIEPWRPSGRWIWNDIHIPSGADAVGLDADLGLGLCLILSIHTRYKPTPTGQGARVGESRVNFPANFAARPPFDSVYDVSVARRNRVHTDAKLE